MHISLPFEGFIVVMIMLDFSTAFDTIDHDVLVKMLYYVYTEPVPDIIQLFGLLYHLYADDTQLYIAFKRKIPSLIWNFFYVGDQIIDGTQHVKAE